MTTYHFVGIKGTGMSALAQILHDKGLTVQGSDYEKNFFTEKALVEKGITILPFSASNVKEDMIVIQGNAFSDTHEEIVAAKELGVPIKKYHEFLGELLTQFSSIAVTGAHGKTSTTGLLSHVLKGAFPTSYLIGDGTGKGQKDSKYFALEACEYRRHFLSYHPDYTIMTNIDFDHPDYFKDIDDVFSAFQEMAFQVKKGIIACGDDEQLQKIQAKVPVVFYGFGSDNDFQARNVTVDTNGTTFEVHVRNNYFATFTITNYGDHNVLNALAVIALCHYENISQEIIQAQLSTYGGVKRRYNEKKVNDQVLVDDYAHHPTEIIATLDTTRKKFPNKHVIAVFQPHTFSRTKKFLGEFAESLSGADEVILCDIFGSARENDGELTINDLISQIPGASLWNEESLSQLASQKEAVILFMGAGDIQKYQKEYEEFLAK